MISAITPCALGVFNIESGNCVGNTGLTCLSFISFNLILLYISPYWVRQHDDQDNCSVPSLWCMSDIKQLPSLACFKCRVPKRHSHFIICFPVTFKHECDVQYIVHVKNAFCIVHHAHRRLWRCVCSDSTFPDWFHYKIVLSIHPLKLWSHRYVSSICSMWHWIIHLLPFLLLALSWFYTVSFLLCPPNFLSTLLLSIFVSVLFIPFFHPLLLTLSSLYPHSASSHSSSISQPPVIPSLCLHSLSFSSSVSPEAILSHHSSSFINTCTHAAEHAQPPHI